ncbi:NAD-specific glutamate dehydrogenase [Candidatus Photodesmus katoptron]|uniref:NAD-glutamate dehydrogenase n=1 Tax=Candidatus Photodesmus anomalopis TaxID=28176 RepID=UPI0004D7941D|nr:NAD-glutamate dehydrogenase [Candidatus Photodesmus katoptron]KEY90673.1 NAD-specific glutamate dehydrogenase [Candidatus Photodesmus katoptron]
MMYSKTLTPTLLKKIYKIIRTKLPSITQNLVIKLAQHLLNNIAQDDLIDRNEYDLYGAIISLWNHINENKTEKISVKVFNPTVNRQGWQSIHTIIEMVMPDAPFLFDSIKMTLNRLDLSAYLMLHGPIQLKKDEKGDIVDINEGYGRFQSLFHIEINRLNDDEKIILLKNELHRILKDVNLIVKDWALMLKKLKQIINEIEIKKNTFPIKDIYYDDVVQFLHWLGDDNFTFMGYKEYDLATIDDETELKPTDEKGLGLFTYERYIRGVKLTDFPDSAYLKAKQPFFLILTKGSSQSQIHRPAYTDYIGIKKFNDKGKVIGEHRFTGLYTSAVYNQSINNIPLVKQKVIRILKSSGHRKASYSYKALHNILENYPRDELLQAKENELLEIAMGVLHMKERDLLRLFIRKDPFGRFFSCMVYITKERYNTELRRQMQCIFQEYFNSTKEVEFTTYFSERSLARTHYIIRVDNNNINLDIKKIEQNLIEVSSTWDDRLSKAIIMNFGESKGLSLSKKYMKIFPRSYKESVMPGSAVIDIEHLEKLNDKNKFEMLLYRPQEIRAESKIVRLKLYHQNHLIHLSDVMPMLENLNLRVIRESPYEVSKLGRKIGRKKYWILDFLMLHNSENIIDFHSAKERFQQAFSEILSGNSENDGFNRLILNASLSVREISILRAYASYMRQVGFPFSLQYIEDTLNHYPEVAKNLINLFIMRFDPKLNSNPEYLLKDLKKHLRHIDNLDDDRIIRRYIEIILATLRTNYYQKDEYNKSKAWLSLKIKPNKIADIPKPIPEFEIFVYASDMEGVHLRGGKIARGGVRWSDRQEDFRTEILGLLKAQQVKNTVIVPVGAKGGFICKKQHMLLSSNEIFKEAQHCYKRFIKALLDITDNIIEGKTVTPKNVVCYDSDDPYLVVAADKGTSSFSDLANSLSKQYNFWLGDAFASGGSNGYDHKSIGITAKGVWESVKRHFREIGINYQTKYFTAIGIGDMGGDVFGNGMLLSKNILLQAAFNHTDIFIDPNPEPNASWKERNRLFNISNSSWKDYNPNILSKGGGIFSRCSKSIFLTKEMQNMLSTKKISMSSNELIKSILSMKADLLWNGGVGTYVKASNEKHIDVGDHSNDMLRIDACNLKAKVVAEGGNLGMTQLGRIEYALLGGQVNTDFVDNVSGVACSDNEVNIKILLNSLMQNGDLTIKQRNNILSSMESEVNKIVLNDAYCQSESISVTEYQGISSIKEQIRFIHVMERSGYLDRTLENIPDDETLLERAKQGMSLTKPELSILIAYSKMILKNKLVHKNIINDQFHSEKLLIYFPMKLGYKYSSCLKKHPLRSEIISTVLANQMVNEMGYNFVTRLQEETGANIADITNSYVAAREIYNLGLALKEIRQLDNIANTKTQYDIISYIRRTLRGLSRWLLRNHAGGEKSVKEIISLYQVDIQIITKNLDKILVAHEVDEHNITAKLWIEKGISEKLANYIARLSSLYSVLDISTIARQKGTDIQQTAKLYYYLGNKLSLHWFLKQINNQAVDNNWQDLAKAAFREDLNWQQRQLTRQVLSCKCKSEIENFDAIRTLDKWLETNKLSLNRWKNVLNEFKVGSVHEFAKFSVALRELMLLNLICTKN